MIQFTMTLPRSIGYVFVLIIPWLWGYEYGPSQSLMPWVLAMLGLTIALLDLHRNSRCFQLSLLLAASISVAIATLQFVGVSNQFVPWVSESAEGQAYANLRQRNLFASLCVMGWLALLLGFRDRLVKPSLSTGQDSNGSIWRLVIWVLTAWAAWGLAMSSSRTGALQWLTIVALIFMWRKSLQEVTVRFVLGGIAWYALWVSAMPWVVSSLNNESIGLLSRINDTNAFSRIDLWSNVLELIWREPLLGHGWRSLAYVHYSSDFSGARFMEMLDNAHNLPLHLAVELGLPVALGFCGLVGWLIWKNKPWAETRLDRQLAWGVLLVIGIHSMLEYPLWYGPFFMTAVICIGILCGDLWRNWLIAGTDSARSAIQLGVRSFAILLLVATGFVAFDYHRVSQIYLQPDQRSAWYAADPLGAAKQSVFFQSHAKFAELQITPLSRESAPRVLELSSELVRWSPEPRIIEKLIESSVMLGLDDVAAFHLKRYRIAYPHAYALWAKKPG
ncbi:Wzy polymerase domain-containing protein [Variovorax sp. PCZ-1]|uniref:PglL family O-oligosaccharyltransferase n=1 Tax=Variovorax sp. PCZ-1 TaxID=2835533 RepID=UPI001BCCC3FD|nr:Wzy polymerase domain-containing protein [Variovorax sp. PCZ-1]MBS7806056.1 O-antigen ligase C-terminal domain-containing protein [Variovorax sp. PCZ-1]